MKATMIWANRINWGNREDWKRRIIELYFALSFCALSIGDDSPIWAVALVVLNFANAARIVRKEYKWFEESEELNINEI